MADQAMDLLANILSNPDAMENIKHIISDAGAQQSPPPAPKSPAPSQSLGDISGVDLSFLTNLLNKNAQSMAMITKLKRAYDTYVGDDDKNIRLLNAISPYLSQKRLSNFGSLVKMIRIGRAAEVFTKNK